MTKKSFNLRNAVKSAVAVLAVALMGSGAMAQTFQYTDASGVSCTYEISSFEGIDGVNLVSVDNLPASVTKWVMPETIVNSGTTYRFFRIGAYVWNAYDLISSSLQEIVFPKYLFHIDNDITPVSFPVLHKITFGENASLFPDCNVPLDTLVFWGTGVIHWDGSLYNFFKDCPPTTKIFIPCGTMQQFLTAFANSGTRWNEYNGWTSANFIESPCLNTLTVLSSDNALGYAYSFAGCGFVTQTPNNTSATYSGNITLLALPQANKVFTGWNDGNLDNPRVVNVTADVTYTANFATCSGAGIEGVQANAPLKVFPNPANSTLNVELERQANGTLALFDLSGKAVYNQAVSGTRVQINLSGFAPGTYILRLVENGAASAGVKV